MSEGSKILVTDMDDVLVHISTPWLQRAFATARFGSHPALAHLPRDGGDLFGTATARPQYYLQEWIKGLGVEPGLIPFFDEVYRQDAAFYDELPPTKFCASVLGALALPRRMAHVHIISHCYSLDDPCTESKRRWVEAVFGDYKERYTLHLLEASTSKTEVMRRYCPTPTAFADDSMKNVVDVLLDESVTPSEIIIPQMGHNHTHPQVGALALLRRVQLSYYAEVD